MDLVQEMSMSSNSGHGDVVEFARALEEDGPLLVGWLEWLPLEHVL